jgi:hypothetical protein
VGASDNNSRVQIDFNHEPFQREFLALDVPQLKLLHRVMKRVASLTWQQVYDDHGLNWERIIDSNDRFSIRLNQQSRAVVTRQGNFMRFESLHFDHDSAYKK